MASSPFKRPRAGHDSRDTRASHVSDALAANKEQPAAEHSPHATARAALVRVAIIGLFVIAVLFTLDFAHAILIPIVAAMLLGTVLSPVVERMLKYHIPAPLGAGLLVIALVLITVAVAAAIAQPLSEWLEYLPATMGSVSKGFLQWWGGMSGKMGLTASASAGKNAVAPEVAAHTVSLTGYLMALAEKVIAGTLVALFLLYFILSNPSLFTLKLVRVIPRWRDKVRAVEIVRTVRQEVSTYFLTITLINFGLGVCTTVIMYLLGMPNPLLWGVMAMLFNFVPYLGPMSGLVVLTLAALHTFDAAGRVIAVPVAFFVLVLLEGQVLQPFIVGRRLQCNPVMVFGSFAVWGWLWGVAGLVVAVPLLVVLKTFAHHVPSFTPLAEFLNSD
jgi:predicted PurR-regulated permease PerM